MGTNFIQTSLRVGEIKTTRTILITTGAAQRITLLTSGAILVNFHNLGPVAAVVLGDSAMAAGSGDTIFPFANREFYPVSDSFFTYARATSIDALLAVTEYRVG